ncbi:MAG: response regulator, partial [Deltaproteobacteria bacterium]|nr:response regulator [Deltaproteobacteria bacterium]
MQNETSYRDKTSLDHNLASLKILVVDDEPLIRETLRLFLNKLGIEHITTMDDGRNALQELERITYDYVFIDLMMPGINGLQTLKIIQEYHSPTNVIIMTGFPSMDVVIEAMRLGASDFLVKPFRSQDIKITLNRLQRFRLLMKKNWGLQQELEKKKELEQLNNQLQKRIRLQSLMYNIIDSLSRINQSEELYTYLVTKAIEYCNAKKACFMIYDENNARLLTLAQKGLKDSTPGLITDLKTNSEGRIVINNVFIKDYFGKTISSDIHIDRISRLNGFMAIPFNIRKEPFGILLMSGKNHEKSFDQEDEFILKFLADKTALNIENIALYDNIKLSLMASLNSLVSALEAKDKYTQQHSKRVTDLS